MCISATTLLMISAGVQAVGSIMQGSQQEDLANARAQESETVAAQNRADADVERERSEVEADRIRRMGSKAKSQARSALAKSGVVADAGSALTIQSEITAGAEQDALTAVLDGSYRARKLELGAAKADREAGYQRQAGENAFTSGILQAGGSLLTGYGYATGKVKSGWAVQQ